MDRNTMKKYLLSIHHPSCMVCRSVLVHSGHRMVMRNSIILGLPNIFLLSLKNPIGHPTSISPSSQCVKMCRNFFYFFVMPCGYPGTTIIKLKRRVGMSLWNAYHSRMKKCPPFMDEELLWGMCPGTVVELD